METKWHRFDRNEARKLSQENAEAENTPSPSPLRVQNSRNGTATRDSPVGFPQNRSETIQRTAKT